MVHLTFKDIFLDFLMLVDKTLPLPKRVLAELRCIRATSNAKSVSLVGIRNTFVQMNATFQYVDENVMSFSKSFETYTSIKLIRVIN